MNNIIKKILKNIFIIKKYIYCKKYIIKKRKIENEIKKK